MAVPRITRRRFVAGALAAPAVLRFSSVLRAPKWSAEPFSLGVASGDPLPDGFVLWTRLAPVPLSTDPASPGGMPPGDVELGYEIAADEAFSQVVQRGSAKAEAAWAHAVHLEVTGLAPARPYWYRFHAGDSTSPVGRTQTAPAPGAPLARLRVGCVSCSNYEAGWFASYRHLAAEQPDLVLFLGDYIYEYLEKSRATVRTHSDGAETKTLAGYRNRYAQYRTDPDLQRVHACAPALMTWDDHEVQNDYADRWSQDFADPDAFLARRAAAYQAFYEHMPLRAVSRPQGASLRLYDRYAFGDLVEFQVLDGRQYRSREACWSKPSHGGGHVESAKSCPELVDPARSMIGMAQEKWLADGLSHSKARWNVIAQDVMMAQLRERQADGSAGSWTDDWNGYPVSRARLLQHVHDAKVKNPVVLGGDIHSFWANDLKLDFDDPKSPVVASELIGTSISSWGPPYEKFAAFAADNPHVHFFDSRQRGYLAIDLAPERLTARFQVISDVRDPKATLSTLASFSVENGRPGPQRGS
ncbi:MAG TPA: alkaline phosphatase D family protein [Myxococcota bacterium]|nr:alkaline phosphatase D family protein [Myxococcota bacterium]